MTLGRTIWFFVKLGIVVWVAVLLADRPGRVSVTWLGYNVDLAVGTALAVVVIAIYLLYLLWRLWHAVRRAPTDYTLFRRSRRQAKGFKALTRGLVAAAAGDAGEAKRLAKTAHGLLDKSPLTLLLAAQAAQLEGDEHAAGRYFEALAKDPEAALLGLRGLTTAALKRGDEAAALAHAEQALQSNPRAEWAAETAHQLQVKLGRPAEDSLKALVRAGAMSAKAGQRRRSVLLAEKARLGLVPEASEAGPAPELDTALRAAREALKLDSGSVPARLILAHLLQRAGKRRESARLIEQVWDTGPHPLLARAYIEAEPGERPLDRMKRLERLVRQNADHVETHRALATAALAAGLWGEARRHLERLVAAERRSDGLSQATCRAMAALEDGERADPATAPAAARRWLDEAARALPDPTWLCATCGHPGEAGPASGHWQAVCPHCGSIDSYQWQRPFLPSGDVLLAAPESAVAQAPVAQAPVAQVSVAAAEIPAVTPASVAPIQIAEPVATSDKNREKPPVTPSEPASRLERSPEGRTGRRVETAGENQSDSGAESQLGPSVDAARLIN